MNFIKNIYNAVMQHKFSKAVYTSISIDEIKNAILKKEQIISDASGLIRMNQYNLFL